jgi:hypothetical protein
LRKLALSTHGGEGRRERLLGGEGGAIGEFVAEEFSARAVE